MPFSQSFYAEQTPAGNQQHSAASAAIPSVAPIAEDPLSPAQIQEAIRIYRSVLSTSAPSSPVRHAQEHVVPAKPVVHSNYYGGGPTDIPQSYLLNYATSPSRAAPAPMVHPPAPMMSELTEEQQLIARLQAIQLEKQGTIPVSPAVEEPVVHVSQTFQKATPKRAHVAQRMYDDEESGYCFNRQKNGEQEVAEEFAQEETQQHFTEAPPAVTMVAPQSYVPVPAPNKYSKAMSGPSEYIGMSNDNKFIYDAQRSVPMSYTQNNSYTLVNAAPQAVIVRPEEVEEHGTTTTEDVTQVPASPAVTSRFRGLVKNAQTPIQATAPIVVERVGEQSYHDPYNNHNYDAFMPVNQMSMESEYQLPVLNDLASCIEHY